MSVVVAVKKDDTIYFGADTQTTRRRDKYNSTNISNLKIQKLDNGLIFACTGNVGLKQFILSNPQWLEFDINKGLTKQQIVVKMVPNIYKGLKDEGLLDNEDKDFSKMEGEILLGYKDKLYQICSSFLVLRYNDYQAIGCGNVDVQYGLTQINRSMDINKQLLKILKISEKHNSAVSGPFVFIDTKNLKYTILEDDNDSGN